MTTQIKSILLTLAVYLIIPLSYAQIQCPGITVIGRGYDIFGEYANNKSVKEQLFMTEVFQTLPMDDGQEYKVPEILRLKYINEKDYKTTEGSSLRQYATSMSLELGMEYDGLAFGGSVESRFGKDKAGLTKNYFYTITDWTRVWEVYINPSKEQNLRQYLTTDAKTAIDTWAPEKLFEVYGTHYVNSGYFGGAMEFNLSEEFKSKSEAKAISVSVQAKFAAVSGNSNVSYNSNQVNESFKSNVKIYARGGDVQYANKSSVGDNTQYNLWVQSIPTKAVLIDFKKGSLIPIWNLASTQQRKAQLEAAFKKTLALHPLPQGNSSAMMMADEQFYIRSISENLYWDLNGYHYYADAHGAKVQLFQKDVNKEGKQGADRFIKIIPHTTKTEFVFFQPQHSDFVADITGGVNTPGAELQLWNKGEDNAGQMFKMIEVAGEPNTYFIECSANGLYLTAKNGKITQEAKTNSDNQKWAFEGANAQLDMADIPTEIYAIANVASRGKFLDIPGSAPNQQGKGAKIVLWGMDHQPDRYVRLETSTENGYYFIYPMNSDLAFNIEGAANDNGALLQIWESNKSIAQTFKFEYAGSPLTYYIIQKGSNKVLDASNSKIAQDGCPVQLWTKNNTDNQKWKLTFVTTWQMPDPNQNFFIKSAYIDKYIDLPGNETESNQSGKGVQIWDMDGGKDRIFKIVPTGQHSWVNIQIQNGGRYLTIPSNASKEGTQMIVHDKTNSNDQMFALQFTSPTTFALRTNNWKAMDISGGSSDAWKKNGATVIQYSPHYGANQQFQLIYADGPRKGKVYNFLNKE